MGLMALEFTIFSGLSWTDLSEAMPALLPSTLSLISLHSTFLRNRFRNDNNSPNGCMKCVLDSVLQNIFKELQQWC